MGSAVDDAIFSLLEGSVEARKGSAGACRAKAARIARNAPEVMLKITGYVRTGAGIKHHLDYVARHGALEVEDECGGVLSGKDAVKDLAKDWKRDIGDRKNEARMTTHIVLSMPPGTDPDSVKQAARKFAAKTFGDNYRYVFVLHTDEAHPHVHLTINNQGFDGRKLHIPKGRPQEWRESFAEEMRDLDVEAEATPRATRGVVRKKVKSAVHHMRKRGIRTETDKARVREALEERRGKPPKPRPWEAVIAERQKKVRKNWVRYARSLEETGREEDKAAAGNVYAFVRNMPSPKTERHDLHERIAQMRTNEESLSHARRPKERGRDEEAEM
jgi:type IV secretion system T-DNA border endonuclease VirD2